MVFWRSDRLVLVISIGLTLLATGLAHVINSHPYAQGLARRLEGPLDLNTASFKGLLGLPGIGPTLAQRIILYRERYGPFRSPKELMNVEGIGPTLMEELQRRVTVGEL